MVLIQVSKWSLDTILWRGPLQLHLFTYTGTTEPLRLELQRRMEVAQSETARKSYAIQSLRARARLGQVYLTYMVAEEQGIQAWTSSHHWTRRRHPQGLCKPSVFGALRYNTWPGGPFMLSSSIAQAESGANRDRPPS
jgi:hypothetical protein